MIEKSRLYYIFPWVFVLLIIANLLWLAWLIDN